MSTSLLVLFDVPARAPRKLVQRKLERMGFKALFPNAYERHGDLPALKEVEHSLYKILRGEVFRLRIYRLGARTKTVERWGR